MQCIKECVAMISAVVAQVATNDLWPLNSDALLNEAK